MRVESLTTGNLVRSSSLLLCTMIVIVLSSYCGNPPASTFIHALGSVLTINGSGVNLHILS